MQTCVNYFYCYSFKYVADECKFLAVTVVKRVLSMGHLSVTAMVLSQQFNITETSSLWAISGECYF